MFKPGQFVEVSFTAVYAIGMVDTAFVEVSLANGLHRRFEVPMAALMDAAEADKRAKGGQ